MTFLLRCGDVEVAAGELVAITGPNGAGKTTLVRQLLGLDRPRAGRVERAPGLTVGYVPQLDPGDPGLPFPASAVVKQGGRGDAKAALARAGYAAPPSRRYRSLSGGERRRVLLARAIVGAPRLLVLDEPTAGVDREGGRDFLRVVLEEVRGRGAGAIWVCHGAGDVEGAADRVLRL
jgi:zinc transport system ATP-binding protein